MLRTTSMENGRIIGEKYQIVKRLSEGGMGTVYVARHTGLGSLVAIKLLKSDGDPLFEQRFVQELSWPPACAIPTSCTCRTSARCRTVARTW